MLKGKSKVGPFSTCESQLEDIANIKTTSLCNKKTMYRNDLTSVIIIIRF